MASAVAVVSFFSDSTALPYCLLVVFCRLSFCCFFLRPSKLVWGLYPISFVLDVFLTPRPPILILQCSSVSTVLAPPSLATVALFFLRRCLRVEIFFFFFILRICWLIPLASRGLVLVQVRLFCSPQLLLLLSSLRLTPARGTLFSG